MADTLAQIRYGAIIRTFASERGWFTLENGQRASPPQAGYEWGNDKIVPIIYVIDDQSTGRLTKTIETVDVNFANVIIYQTIVDDVVPSQKINNERDRRINMIKTVSLTSGKSFPCDMDNGGRANIDSLGAAAIAKMLLNDTTTFSFRDANNVDWELTNDDVIEMGLQIARQVEALHVKSRALKAMRPIPPRFADDSYWE